MMKWLKVVIVALVLLDFLTPDQIGIFQASAQGLTSPTVQFPTNGWNGYAPALVQCGTLIGANMNSTADQPIYITVPTVDYHISAIEVSAPSVSLTTAAGGIYSAVSKGGTAIVAAGQVYSGLTTQTSNNAGSTLLLTLNSTDTTKWNLGTIYFSLTTAQGAAATANIRVRCNPLYK